MTYLRYASRVYRELQRKNIIFKLLYQRASRRWQTLKRKRRLIVCVNCHVLFEFQISPTLATSDALEGYTQVASHPLHKTVKPGITSVDIHPSKVKPAFLWCEREDLRDFPSFR